MVPNEDGTAHRYAIKRAMGLFLIQGKLIRALKNKCRPPEKYSKKLDGKFFRNVGDKPKKVGNLW